jgi:hypothetical protein
MSATAMWLTGGVTRTALTGDRCTLVPPAVKSRSRPFWRKYAPLCVRDETHCRSESSNSASSPYQSEKPVPERTDPGDPECQPDGKGSLRPNAIKNVSEVEHDTDHQGRGPAHRRQHRQAAGATRNYQRPSLARRGASCGGSSPPVVAPRREQARVGRSST